MSTKDNARVPTGRISRFAKLGSLMTGVAGGMIAEGARQLAKGNRPKASELLLTPSNAKRVADQLSQLRGAAMKVGQLLSMDSGDLLPPELTEILSRLRSDAKPMPFSQVTKVLQDNWGEGWNDQFQQFSFEATAAASIGQVHSAHTKDGRHLALKIQYPGIRQSISSDVDNVATLLRVSGLIPKEINYKPLLEEAKQQLHAEADYEQEANWLRRYKELLSDRPEFLLPDVYDEFSTQNILAMSFVAGVPVETIGGHNAHDKTQPPVSQDERDRVMSLLMELLFREIFEFRIIQTDPNFANYHYDSHTGKIILLDFGATREYPLKITEAYRALMQGAIENDRASINDAAAQIGFFQENIQPEQREAVIDLFVQACEPLTHDGLYDFAQSNLAKRISETGMALSMDKGYWHTPPADAIFLHRKLGGFYLLAAKLKARVDMRALFLPYMK
ncbi:ABC1 kinase family protein [Neptunomonas antarctica]|uniref:Predicted unusual protein kinase regulating ubiquinone biosynthesis, AarF/ABC1/UbiB family n=1 Tax=Neptunomonas antarctica TaxID=619304 RepID=A0A1N7NEB5_9GAMM|nr:AarF/ABC1/UbiB kinase family protein [Neptunomonas antarctica]SIS96529.1 Predicted unusual protein kinase regulating ubiquinone biosynthesis, AarF/ABC1/UbiB family [Neptunomonas antarctica]